jgi:cell envelope opacity-associated protein A
METTTATLTPAQKRAVTNAAKKAAQQAPATTTPNKPQKAVIEPVYTEDEAPEHVITDCDPAKKTIFGQTHWITFTLPNGATQMFAHKGKPKPADIIAIHRAMMLKYNREAELKAQAEERHREAVKRLSSN